MASPASPYATFKAEDWMLPPAPIGIGQCVRVRPKKRYQENASTQKKNGSISNMELSKNPVQLAFA